MPILFTLSYKYPDWIGDLTEEIAYLDHIADLAEAIKDKAERYFKQEVYYIVKSLTPENSTDYCSPDTPNIMIVADVPNSGEDDLQTLVDIFSKDCLDIMQGWSTDNEKLLSWWRLFQDSAYTNKSK